MHVYFTVLLTLIYDAVLRSQDLFPWKQGAGGEMATPPKWGKKLVLALVNQVGAQIVFQGIFNHKMKVFRNNTFVFVYKRSISTYIPWLYCLCDAMSSRQQQWHRWNERWRCGRHPWHPSLHSSGRFSIFQAGCWEEKSFPGSARNNRKGNKCPTDVGQNNTSSISPNRGILHITKVYVRVFVCALRCIVGRVSPGGSDVPLAEFSGAVLPFPATAAAGWPVPGPAEEAPSPAPPPDEGSPSLLPPASPGQEQHHQQSGRGHQPATVPQSTERGWESWDEVGEKEEIW